MINSLLPSVFPTVNPAQTNTDQPQSGQLTEKSASVHISGSSTARSLETNSHGSREARESDGPRESRHVRHGRHDHHDHGKSGRSERSDLFRTAKHMIKDAFREFRHDIRDSFRDLGFDPGIAKKIAKGVMHAAKDALRSGADFSAKMMVAAVSHTQSITAAGTSSSFNMVASSIEVSINHATGSIDVNTANVSIEAHFNNTLAAPQPHLLDIHDSDAGDEPNLTGALIAPEDVDSLFEDDEEAADAPPPVIPAIVTTAREAVNNSLGSVEEADTSEVSTTRTAVEAVLESAAKEEAAPVDDADETKAAQAAEEVPDDAEKAGLDLPEIFTPLLLNRPEYSARIFITAYEHSINERQERITFMRFDAVMPLTAKPAEPTPVITPPTEIPVVETPVVETGEDETESQVA